MGKKRPKSKHEPEGEPRAEPNRRNVAEEGDEDDSTAETSVPNARTGSVEICDQSNSSERVELEPIPSSPATATKLSFWMAMLSEQGKCSPALATPPLPVSIPENCAPSVLAADMSRSLWHSLPQGEEGQDENKVREIQRERLKEVIVRALVDTEFHYYQGLHEVLSVVTLAAPTTSIDELAVVARSLVGSKLSIFCGHSLDHSQSLLAGLHAVLVEETGHGRMAQLLELSGVGPDSHYALPWLITWFSHNVDDQPSLLQLFDFLISEEGEDAIVFVCAALVLENESYVLDHVFQGKVYCDHEDFGVVYAGMSSLPQRGFAVASLTATASTLACRWKTVMREAVEKHMQEREEALVRQRAHRMAEKESSPHEGDEGSPVISPSGRNRGEQWKVAVGVAALVAYSVSTYMQPSS